MTGSRIDALLAMRERNPGDSRILFALAVEYEKLEKWNEVIEALRSYLDHADDQGNAWGRLARALSRVGRTGEARAAFQKGIDAATRHGHPSMADEFREESAELE